MKRTYCTDFLVDGLPLLDPDADVAITISDMEGDSGTDEAGIYHRFVVRQNVHSWTFSFKTLTVAEYVYLGSLFHEKTTFKFTYPGPSGGSVVTTAYRAEMSISYYSKKLGLYKNLSFSVKEC